MRTDTSLQPGCVDKIEALFLETCHLLHRYLYTHSNGKLMLWRGGNRLDFSNLFYS